MKINRLNHNPNELKFKDLEIGDFYCLKGDMIIYRKICNVKNITGTHNCMKMTTGYLYLHDREVNIEKHYFELNEIPKPTGF